MPASEFLVDEGEGGGVALTKAHERGERRGVNARRIILFFDAVAKYNHASPNGLLCHLPVEE